MTNHVTDDDLRRFRHGELPAAETLRVGRHIGECDECSARARMSVAGEHPDIDALFDHADGKFDPQIAAHLAQCSSCREDVADARAVAAPPRRVAPWLIAAAVAAIVVAVVLVSRRPVPAPAPRQPQPAPALAHPEWAALVESARRERRLDPPPAFAALQAGKETLRSRNAPHGGAVLSPANTVVETPAPTFRWPATPDGQYVVRVFENEREVVRSAPLRDNAWTPPQPLQRGATYAWEVEVRVSGAGATILPTPPDPPALFTVATGRDAAEIAEAQRVAPRDRLLLGVLYARAGVRERAEDELAAWAAEHPADSVARDLLQSVRRW